MSQELAENDLQTDPENHLHPQPHLSTPIITLFPPTVMNSLPIFLYSHTLCGGWLWKPEVGFIYEGGKPRIGFVNEYYPNRFWRDEYYSNSD